MLVGNVGVAAMCKRVRQVLVRAGTGLEDMEFVSGKWGGSQEGAEEARWLGRIQDGCWGHWKVTWFAFIPESGLCLWYSLSRSGARTRSAGSHVLLLSGLPFHLMRYCNVLECP